MDIVTYKLSQKYADRVAAGFSSVRVDGLDIIFTLNDGKTATVTVPAPKDGEDGVSITNVSLNQQSHLICTLSDGTAIDAGLVHQGVDGKDGKDGADGAPGQDGKDGKDGVDGQDGNGIISIEKTGTEGLVDTYTIYFTNGTTTTFTVTNGSGGSGTGNYTDLTNKPTINNVELNGNKTSSDLGLQPAGNYVTNTDYATSSVGGVLKVSNGDYGMVVDEGVLKGTVRTVTQYENMSSKGMICKGTLENVLTDKDYQEELVSGTNIKTINGNSILGSGNLVIESGTGGLTSVAHDNTMTGAGTNESPLGVDSTKFATASQGSKADSAYQKPNTGIPENDLSDAVKQKLNSGGVYTTLYTFNEAYANWCSGQQFPILICGDSTIAGRGTTDELGKTKAWVKRLEEKLKYECNNQNIKLYNVAVSGSSLPEPSTFDTWFGPNGEYNDSKMVGIGWGINDRLSYQNKKAYYEGVYSKVKALIEKAFSLNIQPFLITSQSTMESNVSQQYSSQYPLRNAENINTCANNAKRDLAKEYNIEVVDLNELTEIYLKKSNVAIDTIIPDKLHFADRGNLFEAGAVFTKMVSRTIVVNQKDETILSYADQHITNAVKQDDLSYGGNLKVYTSYTKPNTTDQKIFDAYVYIKDTQATITAYKTSLESSTYVIIDNEVPEDKQTVSLTTLETALSDLEIGLHHLEVYTGESTKVDFAGFIINNSNINVPLQSIAFSPSSYSVATNQSVQTTLTFNPSNASNKNVTYSATGGTISSSGVFSATTVGTYTVTATSQDGGFTDTCTITVTPPAAVSGVTLDKNSATIDVGETTQLVETVAPSNAGNKNVTWSSSDSTIVTVSNSGLVTGISKGNATITVTTVDGGFTDTCAVTVNTPPTKIYDTIGSGLTEYVFTSTNESGFFYPNYDSNDLTTSLSGKTITKVRAKLEFTGNSATMSYGRATLTGNATSLSDIVETKTVTVLKSEQDSNGYVTMDLGSLHIGEHETLSIGNPDGTDTAKPYFLDANSSNLPGRALLTKNHTYGSMSIGYSCQIWGYDN